MKRRYNNDTWQEFNIFMDNTCDTCIFDKQKCKNINACFHSFFKDLNLFDKSVEIDENWMTNLNLEIKKKDQIVESFEKVFGKKEELIKWDDVSVEHKILDKNLFKNLKENLIYVVENVIDDQKLFLLPALSEMSDSFEENFEDCLSEDYALNYEEAKNLLLNEAEEDWNYKNKKWEKVKQEKSAKTSETEEEEEKLEEGEEEEIITEIQKVIKTTEEIEILKNEGNEFYKVSDFDNAIIKYSEGINFTNDFKMLSILYSNRSACYMSLDKYDLALKDVNNAILKNINFYKPYLRRYKINLYLKKYNQAVIDLRKVLELQPNLRNTYEIELKKYEKIAEEQQEMEKQEMMNKLKDFGGWALGKFGLSLDNFKVEQNEKGAYNIQFQK